MVNAYFEFLSFIYASLIVLKRYWDGKYATSSR